MTTRDNEPKPGADKPKVTRQRVGFLEGKYPPMSLEDFNASNDEIAEWFYEGSIFPDNDKNEDKSET